MTTLTPEQQQDLARSFQGLATQWDTATRYRSNMHALRDHPVYQKLVALGEPVVPLILRELEREPNVFWFVVLSTITGENPVPPALAGRVEAMAWAWIETLGAAAGLRILSAKLEGAFPNLATDGYTMASPKTHAYNCIAWAAGDASRWWEPGIYWPGPAGDDLAALIGLFTALGYTLCAEKGLETGYEKVALYADDQGEWTHATRQLPDGWWTSKLGPDEDILHRTIHALVGDLYGQVQAIMKRPLRTT